MNIPWQEAHWPVQIDRTTNMSIISMPIWARNKTIIRFFCRLNSYFNYSKLITFARNEENTRPKVVNVYDFFSDYSKLLIQ